MSGATDVSLPAPVRVITRIRPPLTRAELVMSVPSPSTVQVVARNKRTLKRGERKGEAPKVTEYLTTRTWGLDSVYDMDVDTTSVYVAEITELINNVLIGRLQTACILAFGQTGSGKTFTISGGHGCELGIVHHVAVQVADGVAEMNAGAPAGAHVQMFLAAGEIYQEQLFDLGGEGDSKGKPRRLTPVTLSRVQVHTAEDIMAVLEAMIDRRAQGATNKNEYSSRSHAVYNIILECEDNPRVPIGMIGLADLAGAEYAAATDGCDGMRRAEGSKNNLGLMTLRAAFKHVAQEAAGLTTIPFSWHRSSLTRLLKPFLVNAATPGSNSLLLLITVSPEAQDAEQSSQALSDGVALVGRAPAVEVNEKLGEEDSFDEYYAPVAARGGSGGGSVGSAGKRASSNGGSGGPRPASGGSGAGAGKGPASSAAPPRFLKAGSGRSAGRRPLSTLPGQA